MADGICEREKWFEWAEWTKGERGTMELWRREGEWREGDFREFGRGVDFESSLGFELVEVDGTRSCLEGWNVGIRFI